MNTPNIPLPSLLEMIRRYFDCELSDVEERQLRSIIADCGYSHPAIDEAKAVMGFLKPKRQAKVTEQPTPKRWMPLAGVAAAAAVIIALGASLYLHNRHFSSIDGPTCIAYINGAVVTDEEEVLRQLTADIREFSDCALDARQSLREELDEVFPLINDYESDPMADQI